MKVYNEEHGISNKRKCEEQEAVPPGPRELLGEFVNVEKANKLKKKKKKTTEIIIGVDEVHEGPLEGENMNRMVQGSIFNNILTEHRR